jgi:type I restriction enzyme S subunit
MNTKQLRQKILDLAIRGKLVPQDPNDEPASVLLERVRAEKERLTKEGKIKRDKKDSSVVVGADKLHYEQLPGGWDLARITDVFIVNPRNDIDDDTFVSFVPMTLVSDGFSNRFTFQERKWKDVKSGFTHFQNDDVGIAKITPCLENRKSVVFTDLKNGIGAGTTELHIFRAIQDETVLPLYLLWFFKNESFIRSCIGTFAGAVGQQRVGKDHIANTLLPIPPLAEQHRIVAAIESAFAVIDEIERNKSDLQSAVATAKSKILSLAIRGKLVPQDPADEPASALLARIRAEKEKLVKAGKIKRDKGDSVIVRGDDNSYYEKIGGRMVCIDEQIPFEVPESWEWYRLLRLWELLSGRDLTPSEYSAEVIGIPYITGASNFSDGELIINRWTYSPKVVAKNGDLLITCKGTVGAMRINTQGDVHIARQIMAIRNNLGLNVEFLRIVMTSFIVQITSAAKGIIPGISREDLLNMLIPLPPLNEQNYIVNAISNAELALIE